MRQHKVSRKELKYTISVQEYHYLKTLLATFLDRDSHSGDTGDYYVRSLYLDTFDNKDYSEKEAGLLERMKVRFRLYDVESPKVKLEIKYKVNDNQLKETCVIDSTDVIKIIEGQLECLLSYEGDIYMRIYSQLKGKAYVPVVLVDYQREAFIHKDMDIRINFDKNIRSTISYDLFDRDSYLPCLMDHNVYVLEVKYSTVLPGYIKDILSSVKMNKTSYSKYLFAREAN